MGGNDHLFFFWKETADHDIDRLAAHKTIYATENQFDWPVYFNEDVEEKTGIVSEINQIDEIIELPQSSSKQAIYKCMYENNLPFNNNLWCCSDMLIIKEAA